MDKVMCIGFALKYPERDNLGYDIFLYLLKIGA